MNIINQLDKNEGYKNKIISWFSAGVSSAIAARYCLENGNKIDEIIYIDIEDQHPDSLRFLRDCEKFLGQKITILQPEYKSVEQACLLAGGKGYINGPYGAACSYYLKRKTRIKWEYEQNHDDKITYVWGLDWTESNRAMRLIESMPNQNHIFPLIDNQISKPLAHEILRANNIKRPIMYDLGYPNNNCVGCVKGGKGYWNRIRKDFPSVFKKRAEMERRIGATCLKKNKPDQNSEASAKNSVRLYLDELPSNAGIKNKLIVDDCGMFCDSLKF